ncbi:hypothetical protein HPB47_004423 [Ixodes persulcatus]|uniref:Uncharacterized protein n=1 Tax=Ixodes persulcatus TaxID=34615 RepID=A0AC60PFQ5_IXOPE|nr:hypothetical protein HPB47_004423 [Ixodes persulcatus]
MRLPPNDLVVLFRQNIEKKESPTEAGDMQTATGVPGTAKGATILRFLRIQIESREVSEGKLQWSSPDPPQEDRRGTRPLIAQRSLPSALALPTASGAPKPGTGESSVLLQIVKTWATGTTDSTLVRVLLDSGSQRTFIKQESSARLRCPVLSTQKPTIYTFGNTKRPTIYRCRRVKLALQSQYSTSKVTVQVLEFTGKHRGQCTYRLRRLLEARWTLDRFAV